MTKADIVLIICLAALAAVIGAGAVISPSAGAEVVVSMNGAQLCRLPLNKDSAIEVGTAAHNVVTVQGGAVRITHADCPDKLCMGKTIKRAGETLICLPNRVTVSIEGESGWDAVIP